MLEKDKIVTQVILNSAQEQFKKFGLAKTTMNDIAKFAGKGKSTLYYYFASKEEIFEEVIKMEMNNMFNEIRGVILKDIAVREQLKSYIITKLRVIKEKKNLYTFILEKEINSPILSSYIAILKNSYDVKEQKLIKEILQTGIEGGDIRLPEDKLDIFSELLISCIRGVEIDILINNKYESLEKEIDFLIEFFIKGLQ